VETATLETSESFGHVATALALAQAEFQSIEKNRTAYVRSEKGNYSFNYADLAAVLTAVTPALTKAGLALLQPVTNEGGVVRVQTWLVHGESSEWIRSKPLALEGGRDQKALGIAITYLRRYQIGALLGVAPEDDVDDGQETAPRDQRRSAPPQHGTNGAARTAPPPPDRTLEPGHDPAPMTGGADAAAADPVAEIRKAIADKAWNRVIAGLQSLPPGVQKESMKQEYQAARYPTKNGTEAHS
jgi:hypothetical protein